MNKMDKTIIELLSKSPSQESLSTLAISKVIIGNNGTKRHVNPTLYKLERDGYIIKIAEKNGSKPRWCLNPYKNN